MLKPRERGASEKTREDAQRIAKATQRPGQTREQTKLIAQGIQKGIEQYKKQEKAKARERDKRRKRENRDKVACETAQVPAEERAVYRQSPLPWVLLMFSWLAFAVYAVVLD